MRTAKAAVYEAPNAPFALKEFPLRPAKRGEVLVRVTMSTICRSDIHSYEGRRPNPCPGILGHEIIGVIEEITERLILLAREIAVVIVEQHLDLALQVASTAYVLDRGRVALTGPSQQVRDDPKLLQYLAP